MTEEPGEQRTNANSAPSVLLLPLEVNSTPRCWTSAWDVGAPLPHLLCNGRTAFVAFYLDVPDPAWDGSYVTIVDPASGRTEELGVIELRGVASVRMGAPNDEAIEGHALQGKGLRAYAAHEVHRSDWLEEHIEVNSVHPNHSDAAWRRLHHYLLAFHDEMVECLARELRVRTVQAPFAGLLSDLAAELIVGRAEPSISPEQVTSEHGKHPQVHGR